MRRRNMILLFDSLMVLGLLWLGWRALATPDLFKGIVLFIAFGLLMALAWVRLNAPDVALAEAAVGSGLTGALLLATLGRLNRMGHDESETRPRGRWPIRLALPAGLAAVLVLLGAAVWSLPEATPGLAEAVHARLDESGVRNPVTAVLLNFRAYDTLLEIVVLLLAVAAVWSLARADTASDRSPPRAIQVALVRMLAPVMIVVAGYFLWIGSSAPGGAFQAGAVLGGAGVLLLLSNCVPPSARAHGLTRAALAAGVAVFVVVGLLVMFGERRLLEYPSGWSGSLILVIEVAATVSIGAALAVLFLGGRPEATATGKGNQR
jgi:multisubunit Na+/H+ antiporter MnhB subunit